MQQQSSTLSLTTNSKEYFFEGKKIVERYVSSASEPTSTITHNENPNTAVEDKCSYYLVAATPQEEYRQLKFMESVREEECIKFYEANNLKEARLTDRRLELIRERMKEVETLCRYTQILYQDVLAAHESTFHPTSSSSSTMGNKNENGDEEDENENENENDEQSLFSSKPTIAVGGGIQAARKSKELAKARQHEALQKEGLGSVLSPTSSSFHFDEDAKIGAGYALVFCCERNHPHLRLLEEKQKIERQKRKKNLLNTGNNKNNKRSTKWKSSSEMFEEMQEERKQQEHNQYQNSSSALPTVTTLLDFNDQHLAAKTLKAPSMKEFLEYQMAQIATEDRLAEEERERQELEEQRRKIQEAMGTHDLVDDVTNDSSLFASGSINLSTSLAQQRHEEKKRIQHEILASTRGNQSERESYQISFSCDGRHDDNTFTSESKRLSERLQRTIDESLERLPLAKWGAENRIKKVEVAMMSTLDSLFGVIVGKNKEDAEMFFRQLRKSETIGSELSKNGSSVKDVSGQISDILTAFEKNQETDAHANPKNDDDDDDHEQKLHFTQPSRKRKTVGKFTRIMSRRIPAGGSRACSEILHQLVGKNKNFTQQHNNNKNNSSINNSNHNLIASPFQTDEQRRNMKNPLLEMNPDDDDDEKNNTPMFSKSKSKQQQKEQSTVEKYLTQILDDEAWWMKTTTTPNVELSGLADALQTVISKCTPFVPQHAMDTIVRGGTVGGALDTIDDIRAASLCMLLDGDCGFDFTMKSVKHASRMFSKVVESYYGEVVQTFGDYAVAVFWTRPVSYVIDEHEDDDATTTALPKGVPLYRLSPATRSVLAAMELFKQVKRSCCGVSVVKPPLTEEEKSKMLPYKTRNVDIVKLIRKGAFTADLNTDVNDDGQTVVSSSRESVSINTGTNDDDDDTRTEKGENDNIKNKKKFDPKKLYYNIKGHIDPNVRCSGDALEECVELALLSEKQMRRPIVISSFAAEDCDSAVTRLQRFSHNLIEYFTPISLENLRLDEPPAERLVGRYHYNNHQNQTYSSSSTTAKNNTNNTNDDDNDEHDPSVDLSKSVVTGFQVTRAKNKGKTNFHSIHSEPTLRRLFKNLEPYRNCGYILRSQLKEALYPLCFPDPLRSQAGGSLESELVAQARARFEEYEKNKYDAALAHELGDAASELSPMEAMRLMLLKARKDQRKQLKARAEANSHGDKKSLSENLREQTRLAEKLISNEKAKAKSRQQTAELALTDAGPQAPKKSLFNIEKSVSSTGGNNNNNNYYEVQSDIHPEVMMMYREIFAVDMTGITHDVLDTMLTPLRDNAAKEHVTFPEFCLFAARLQAE